MTPSKSVRIIAAAFCILLWSNLCNHGLSAVNFGGKNHALLIGIGDYAQWPKLTSPAKDAEGLAKTLLDLYNFNKSNVTLLTDRTKEKPTLVNILTHLDRYATDLTESDNLLIFFSGHSAEDDEGETYWIPIDGKQKTKMTWLGHTNLCAEIFASQNFKVKNLCIVTDSPFSSKLILPKPISLSPFDLRYPEKIQEKAENRSREIIAFGDQHWPGNNQTDGLGLFAYYFRQALMKNELDVVDVENLIFDENILFPVSKIAGTKLVRGRIRTPMDEEGQLVLAKIAISPVVDVLQTNVSPEKGYPGDIFTIKAVTSGPAYEVYMNIEGKRHRMKGKDTEWEYSQAIEEAGSISFYIAAVNEKDQEGKRKEGSLQVIKSKAPAVNIQQVTVEPKTGIAGDPFNFTAIMDGPAREVFLTVKGNKFKMKGSGTKWILQQNIDDIGTVDFSVSASNEDGMPGKPAVGNIRVNPGLANIVEIKATPETGYAGEEFTISVKTDRPANSVSLVLDEKTFLMEGSGRNWKFKKSISEVGRKEFSAIAKNIEGIEGTAKIGELLTKKSPLPISSVASVDVSVVAPGKGYAGDEYAFKVKTTASSDEVLLDIEGKKQPMKGSGTDWNLIAKIDGVGTNKYQVWAKNKDGIFGESKEGEIKTTKRPSKPINVISAEVDPKTGTRERTFTFTAKTDLPARSVTLVIGERRYEMSGSGTNWSLKKTIDDIGTVTCSIAAKNEEGDEGATKTASITVYEERFEANADGTVTDLMTGILKPRFVDNQDGTITDRLTSLMWLESPKQIAMKWDESVEYCRTFKYKGYSGWRLPTIGELKKLSDPKQKDPALPPGNPFTNVPTHMGYWSKTKHKFGPKYVYQINMWSGNSAHLNKDENAIVWPVRYVEISE